MSKIKMALVVMALVMAFGTTTAAFAQGDQPPTPPAYGETFWQTFADKLGVTVEKLQTALRDTLRVMVDKALTDGKLTQEQADKAKVGIDKLTFDKPLLGQFWAGRRAIRAHAEFAMGKEALDAAAQKLGMTTQELMTELRSGKTLTDVAKAKNVSADDLKVAIVAAVKAQVDKAVTDGKLTKDQADKIKAQVDKMTLDDAFGTFGMGMGKGWGGGPGRDGFKGNRPGGRQRNQAPQPATPQGSGS